MLNTSCKLKIRNFAAFIMLLFSSCNIRCWRILGVNSQRKVYWLNTTIAFLLLLILCIYHKQHLQRPSAQGDFAMAFSNDSRIILYSAFHDLRLGEVFLVAAMHRRNRSDVNRLICQFWFEYKFVTVPNVSVEDIPEGRDRIYNAVYLKCPCKGAVKSPYAVSLAYSDCDKPQAVLPVFSIPENVVPNGKFAVCIPPLHMTTYDTDALLEMLSLNVVFGAEHFFMYDYRTPEKILQVLKSLPKLVTVLPWHIPLKVADYRDEQLEHIKYYGQMVMSNDCIRRAAGSFEFVVFSDLDEVIVPHGNYENWSQLVRKYPKSTAQFSVRNSFFNLLQSTNASSTDIPVQLKSLRHFRREKFVWRHTERSKQILRPRYIRTVGVHNIWAYLPGFKGVNLETDAALLHHYREDRNSKEKDLMEDKTMMKFKSKIIQTFKQLSSSV